MTRSNAIESNPFLASSRALTFQVVFWTVSRGLRVQFTLPGAQLLAKTTALDLRVCDSEVLPLEIFSSDRCHLRSPRAFCGETKKRAQNLYLSLQDSNSVLP